jgi:hypothetical protein
MAFSFRSLCRSHISLVLLFLLRSAAAAGDYRPSHDFDTGLHTRLGFHGVLLSLSSLSRLSNATRRPNPCEVFLLTEVIEIKRSATSFTENGMAFTNRMVSDGPPDG